MLFVKSPCKIVRDILVLSTGPQDKTVNRQVAIFNQTIINIFSTFVPNKLITFNDRDPTWMNDFIKNKMETPNIQNLYKKWSHI